MRVSGGIYRIQDGRLVDVFQRMIDVFGPPPPPPPSGVPGAIAETVGGTLLGAGRAVREFRLARLMRGGVIDRDTLGKWQDWLRGLEELVPELLSGEDPQLEPERNCKVRVIVMSAHHDENGWRDEWFDGASDAEGRYTVEFDATPWIGKKAMLTAFREAGQKWFPVFRSTPFVLDGSDRDNLPALWYFQQTPDSEAIGTADVAPFLDEAKKTLGVDVLSANVAAGEEIHIHVEQSGAEIDFELYVRPNLGPHLPRLIWLEAREFEWDLPGPDFVSTLCTDEAAIEHQVRMKLPAIEEAMSEGLVAAFRQQFLGVGEAAATALLGASTLSLHQLRSVTVDGAPGIVPDPVIGFPRSVSLLHP